MQRFFLTCLAIILSVFTIGSTAQAQSGAPGGYGFVLPIDMADIPIVPGTASTPNWGGYCINGTPVNILTWQVAPGATSYDLYRGYTTYSGGEFPYGSADERMIATIQASAATDLTGWGYPGQQGFYYEDWNPPYTTYGLTYPNVYYFAIARNSAGTTRSGNAFQITLACAPSSPTPQPTPTETVVPTPTPTPTPTIGEFPITVGINCADDTHARVDVSWNPVAGATNYAVWGDGVLQYHGPGTVQYFYVSSDSGLHASVSVIAFDDSGVISYSAPSGSTVQVPVPNCAPEPTPPPNPPPGVPVLSVETECVNGVPVAHLTWAAIANATSYNVHQIIQDGVMRNHQFNLTGTTADFFMVGPAGVTEEYAMAALNSAGRTPGNFVTVTVPECGNNPNEFSVSAASACVNNAATNTISWASAVGAQYYVVTRMTNGVETVLYAQADPASIVDTNVTTGQLYEYTIQAVNEIGARTVSREVTAVNCETTAPNQPPQANDDHEETDPGDPVVVDVTRNDADPDGRIVLSCVRIITPPQHGTVTVNSENGQVTYTPAAGFSGATDSFVYEVCDDDGATDTATVTILVRNPVTPSPTPTASTSQPAASGGGTSQPATLAPTGVTLFDGVANLFEALLQPFGYGN